MLPGAMSWGRCRKIADGLLTSFMPSSVMAKDAEFVDRPEAVLLAAQRPVAAAGGGVEHHQAVDHVFKHLGAREIAFLGDVADEHDGHTRLLGEAHQFRGGFAHLGDAARQALGRLCLHHLDGVDDD